MKSIVISMSGREGYFTDNDYVYNIKDASPEYFEMLEWLRDNNVWYHSVHRDINALVYEVLYMSDEDAMAFKLTFI